MKQLSKGLEIADEVKFVLNSTIQYLDILL